MAWLPIAFSAAFLDGNADPIAGATVTITIRNAAGTAVVTSGAATERTGESGSYYEYVYTPVADTTYTAVASTNHASALQNWVLVGSATAEQTNPAALTPAEIADAVWGHDPRSLTSPTLTFNAPFLRGDPLNIELIRGDSFTDADGRAIEWTVSTPTDITDADIVLEMRSFDAPADVLTFEGTATFVSGDQWDIKFELTSTDTIGLNTRQRGPGPTYYAAPIAVFNDETPVRRVTLIKRVNVFVDGTPGNL